MTKIVPIRESVVEPVRPPVPLFYGPSWFRLCQCRESGGFWIKVGRVLLDVQRADSFRYFSERYGYVRWRYFGRWKVSLRRRDA